MQNLYQFVPNFNGDANRLAKGNYHHQWKTNLTNKNHVDAIILYIIIRINQLHIPN